MLRFLGSAQQPLLGLGESLLSRYPGRFALKPVQLPKGFEPIPPTSEAEIDATIARLKAKAPEWAALPPAGRAALLRACLDTTLAATEAAATAATDAKARLLPVKMQHVAPGLSNKLLWKVAIMLPSLNRSRVLPIGAQAVVSFLPWLQGSYGQGIGEELVVWVPVVTGLRELAEALEAGGAPRHNGVRRRKDGQAVVDAWPSGMEALLWGGFRGELWLQPNKEPTQGELYRHKAEGTAGEGGVALVLGAGNQLPVVALDILHKLVFDDEVVVCKMNPVNEYLGPHVRKAFQPLVDAGYVEVVFGGGPVGKYLCNHPDIASVHLTGSAATHDAIVWQGKPKQGEPPYKKPVGAELGCVTPYIMVPGQWSASDLEYVADSVAAGLTNNAGHNCLKAELLVTDRSWPQREAFLDALRAKLASLPNRVAYYPGSDAKHSAFLSRFGDAEQLGPGDTAADGAQLASNSGRAEMHVTPWLLKTGLTPQQAATQDENWCGVLQEVCLDTGGHPAAFMAAATDFCNDQCWGTLSCAVFVHPATQRKHRAAFDDLVAGLRYGSVCINVPTLIGFATTKLTWGAYLPGGTPQDIGSGNCAVHNTLLLDHVQKSVLRAPWRFHPAPFWSPSHRNLEAVGRAALRFCAFPSLRAMLPLAGQALQG